MLYSRKAIGCAVILSVLGMGGVAGAKITIDIDYTTYDPSGFFNSGTANGLAARAVLTRAAQTFSDRFVDNLTEVSDVAGTDGGTWSATFNNPATGSTVSLQSPTFAANVVKVYAGARVQGGSTLGVGGPGGFGYSFYPSEPLSVAWKDNIISRGQAGALQATPTDFGRWGGAISFDTATNWHFGMTTTGLTASKSDFLSVATHELGHLFGFGTADSFDALGSGAFFVGPKSSALYGGSVPLGPDVSHWAQSVNSTVGGAAQNTAMSPTITTGTRKRFTLLDFAGMDDLGWDLANKGDANADGKVDFADLVVLAQNYGANSGDKRWAEGDFSDDGNVNFTDLVSLAQNYGLSGPLPSSGDIVAMGGSAFAADWEAALVSVPEPVSLMWVLGAGLMLRRNRGASSK